MRSNRDNSSRSIAREADPMTAPPQSADDAVARRAYEIFCEHGCEHGHDQEDWLQAERELRRR